MSHKLLAFALLLLTLAARAQSGEVVLLIKPDAMSGALEEAFNRLNGELNVHGFQVVTVQLVGSLGPGELEKRADALGAVASVAFVPLGAPEGGVVSQVDIRIGDRVTGTTLKRTIFPDEENGAPAVLALRALELLRSSLRADAEESSDSRVEGAYPESAQTAALQVREVDPGDTEFFVSGGVVFSWSLPDGGGAAGPQYGFGFLHKRFGARLIGQGPLLGDSRHAGTARFEAWGIGVSLEVIGTPFLTKRWRFHVFPSAGVGYLQVRGEAAPPYSGRRDSSWLGTVGAGLEASYRFHPRVSGVGSARSFLHIPQPVVTLADEEFRVGAPMLTTSLELHVFFP